MKTLTRQTRETIVTVSMADSPMVDTGLPFFNHMLTAFLTYARLPLQVVAKGDLRHHLMEDVAITLGAFVKECIPASSKRFGERTVPMDDALVQAVVDVGGRGFFSGKLPSRLYTHVLRSFATQAETTLHVRVLRGKDRHHVLEAAFKAAGLALREAMEEGGIVFSTKGAVKWEKTL